MNPLVKPEDGQKKETKMVRRMLMLRAVLVSCFVLGFSNFGYAEEKNAEEGLVGYWNFNEGSDDKSGNRNDGKTHGAEYVKCETGYALQFDGVDDYVSLGEGKGLMTETATYEALIKMNALPADTNVGGVIFQNYNGIVGKDHLDLTGLFFGVRHTGQLHLRPHDGSRSYGVTSSKVLKIGEWYHVVGIIDGDKAQLYINGQPEGVSKIAYSPPASCHPTIGCWTYASMPFNGLIAELKIYDRALSGSEILEHYQKTDNIKEQIF